MFSKDVPQDLHRQVMGQAIQVSGGFATASSSTLKPNIIPNVFQVKERRGSRSEALGGLCPSLSRSWWSWGKEEVSPRASLKSEAPTTQLLASEAHLWS